MHRAGSATPILSRGWGLILVTDLIIAFLVTIFWPHQKKEKGALAIKPERPAVVTVAPAVRDPLEGNRPCEVIFTEPIQPSLADSTRLVAEGEGQRLYWTGSPPLWRARDYLELTPEARLEVAYLGGHLDDDDRWDQNRPEPGNHLYTPPTEKNDLGFCPGRLYHYPLSRSFLERLWPGAVGLVCDLNDPDMGIYAFAERRTISVAAKDCPDPTLFFLIPNPPGNGRRHRAVFKIEISPA